jgi:hypothetical protein
MARKRIGEFLIEKGLLTEAQAAEIAAYGQRTGLRFGDAGLELKLLSREKLAEVFGPSFAVDFFHLDPQYFPQVTQALLSVDEMLRYGATPLGFKTEQKLFRARKLLNVGFLDPAREDAQKLILAIAEAKLGAGSVHAVKPFLILPDQFMDIMTQVYGLKAADIRARDLTTLDGTLAMYFENVPQADPKNSREK